MPRFPIVMLLVVMLSSIACNLLTASGEDAVPPPDTSPVDIVSETLGPEVTDSRIGFTFNHPDGWTIYIPEDTSTSVAYAYTMQSFEPSPGGGGGFPENESKVDIYVNASETTSLDSISDRLHQDEANGMLTIYDESRVTLDNGLEALVIHANGFQGGDFTGIYTVINDHEIALTGLGDEQFVWQIANSLQVN